MKIIEVARKQRDLLNEGIAWVAVWQETAKNGKKSWFSEDIFPEGGVEKETPIFDEEQKTRLAEIAAIDENAVLLNGDLHSWIGSADEPLNAMSISKGIENHYLMHNALIKSYLAGEADVDELDYGEAQHYPGRYAKDEVTEEMLKQAEIFMQVQPEYEDLQLTEREELGLGCERREDFQGENGMSASDVPDTITIEFPAENVNEDILRDLLNSKNSLIDAALGDDCAWQHEYGTDGLPLGDLPIEFSDGKVRFEWLQFGVDADAVTAWSAFLTAAVKFSKTAKRVIAKDGAVENQKFSFRVFLIKLKMDRAENKWHRRYLLRNLPGDSAFATPESKERWVAAQQAKKAAHTAIEEGGDEVSE